jgi:hypothetical protein
VESSRIWSCLTATFHFVNSRSLRIATAEVFLSIVQLYAPIPQRTDSEISTPSITSVSSLRARSRPSPMSPPDLPAQMHQRNAETGAGYPINVSFSHSNATNTTVRCLLSPLLYAAPAVPVRPWLFMNDMIAIIQHPWDPKRLTIFFTL